MVISGKDERIAFERKLRMGMVGGGRDAFIGSVHRKAAMMHGGVELVAGAFSSTPEKSRLSARDLYLPEDRAYGTWQEMLDRESKLPDDERVDFVSIVTPNHLHYPIARAFVANIRTGRVVQGGSTITQQTAKNIFKREKRSYHSKLKEMMQAFLLERRYTKEEILEMYANQFFVTGYGKGLWIAAQYFFGKDPRDLDLVEAAFIAGSLKGPNRYNPFIKKTLIEKDDWPICVNSILSPVRNTQRP